MQSNSTKYPIFYCLVKGFYYTNVKPSKRNPNPKPKAHKFTIKSPIKFENDGETVLTDRIYSLSQTYSSITRDTKITFEYVEKIKYLGYTKIRV